MTTAFYYITMILLVVVACVLMMVILIQKGRGGGLSSSFGGVGGHTAFGSKTGDVLTWATAIIFGIFLLLAMATNWSFNAVNASLTRTTPIVAAPKSTAPTEPGKPDSDLPDAPMTADPGVANPPPTAPVGPAQAPPNETLTAPATKPG